MRQMRNRNEPCLSRTFCSRQHTLGLPVQEQGPKQVASQAAWAQHKCLRVVTSERSKKYRRIAVGELGGWLSSLGGAWCCCVASTSMDEYMTLSSPCSGRVMVRSDVSVTTHRQTHRVLGMYFRCLILRELQ